MLLQPAGWGCCYHMIQCSIFTTIDNNKVAHKGNSCSNHQSLSVNIITISINKAWIILHWAPRRDKITHFIKSLATPTMIMIMIMIISLTLTTIKMLPTNGKQRLASLFGWGKELPSNHAFLCQVFSCHWSFDLNKTHVCISGCSSTILSTLSLAINKEPSCASTVLANTANTSNLSYPKLNTGFGPFRSTQTDKMQVITLKTKCNVLKESKYYKNNASSHNTVQ